MLIVPAGVSSCLYTGITLHIEGIRRTMDLHEKETVKTTQNMLKHEYQTIVEAMDFYGKHCISSYSFLSQRFEPVKQEYQEFKAKHFPIDI
ncbi:hypothetical protein A616_17155 [Brevibacillus brevis X23]|nr:hypothetical protein A616_17155 [Brevibacillus brevis X23]